MVAMATIWHCWEDWWIAQPVIRHINISEKSGLFIRIGFSKEQRMYFTSPWVSALPAWNIFRKELIWLKSTNKELTLYKGSMEVIKIKGNHDTMLFYLDISTCERYFTIYSMVYTKNLVNPLTVWENSAYATPMVLNYAHSTYPWPSFIICNLIYIFKHHGCFVSLWGCSQNFIIRLFWIIVQRLHYFN